MPVLTRSAGRHRRPGRLCQPGLRARRILRATGLLAVLALALALVLVLAVSARAASPAPAPTSVPVDLTDVINRLWKYLTVIAASWAGLVFAWGAVRHIGADGDDGEIARARRSMRGAAIGLGLVLLAPLIVATVQKVLS